MFQNKVSLLFNTYCKVYFLKKNAFDKSLVVLSKKTAVKQKHFMKFPPHFQEVFKNRGYRKATVYVEKKP